MTENRNTTKQDYIIDHVGAENWEHVTFTFGNKSLGYITWKLSEMFPQDDCDELAELIYAEVN